MQAALLQTKNLKSSPPKAPSHQVDDARWMKKVIQEEHAKPLQVSYESGPRFFVDGGLFNRFPKTSFCRMRREKRKMMRG